MTQAPLQQFYIPEEQSIYLLSHDDARKLKAWVALCQEQLEQLGYREIALIGKGAYGFVFAGLTAPGDQYVFKFTRVNLPSTSRTASRRRPSCWSRWTTFGCRS